MILLKDDSICLFRSVLYETNSMVIHTDDFVLVVDPTWLPHEVKEIQEYVNNVLENKPLYLLFTHSDFDHILGSNAFPNAKIIASKAFETKTDEEKLSIIEQIKAFDDEYYLTRDYEVTYPAVDWATAYDGEVLTIGETSLTFYQAPGHNSDGIFTVIEPLGLLITGDYFSDVEFPYIYDSSYQYEKSSLKLEQILNYHSIKMLVTGHGNYTKNLFEMKKRLEDSLVYIQRMRELVIQKDQSQIDLLIKDCRFPRNMKKFHKNNQLLFERELKEILEKEETEHYDNKNPIN